MKFSITPTGVNNASTLTGFHTNFLVRWNSTTLLVDAGTLIGRALHALGVPQESVTAVYASHMHPDHVGGLYDIGYRHAVYHDRRLPVYLHSAISETIWDNYLSGVATHYWDRYGNEQRGDRNTFFDFRPLERLYDEEEPAVVIDGLSLRLVSLPHIPHSPCHGVIFDDRIFVTTDTRFAPDILDAVVRRYPIETIFHDCMFSESAWIYHTAYRDILTLPKSLRERLILTHYEDELPIARGDVQLPLAEVGKEYCF
ncbi:MAG: MBL fold metallo-hydrolase [Deltaproteobacteria bacterium]|nr:MBL fold metallo-hydrolase [Deltaproteobacteria bacterium]